MDRNGKKVSGMKWYKNLYMGTNARENCRRIIRKTKAGKLQHNIYLITLPSNEENQLDIIPANQLLQPYYKKQCVWIAGIAVGKEEALEVLLCMVQDVFLETGQAAVKAYLKNRDWK